MNDIQKPLNIQQAAEFLCCKTSYIYNLIYYGKLTAYKPGGKRLLFKPADLEKFAYSKQCGNRAAKAEAILNRKRAG